MAKDVTIRVTGQNPDGTMTVQQVGPSDGNPFAMVASGSTSTATQAAGTGYRARIGNAEVMFASEADFLKADRAFREMTASQESLPSLGGRGVGSSGNWLKTGANAASAVSSFLHGRQIGRKIDDMNDYLDDAEAASIELEALAQDPKYSQIIPILRRLFNAERGATETALGALGDQLVAVDIQTGAGVAQVVSDFVNPTTAASNSTTALTLGAIGIGYLATRDSTNRDNRSSRNRRR